MSFDPGMAPASSASAHVDRFALDRLPPPELLPEFLFEAPQLQFPPRLNCASELLDRWMAQGQGDRPFVRGHEGSWSYAELQAVATRVANVLVEDRAKVEIEATSVVP